MNTAMSNAVPFTAPLVQRMRRHFHCNGLCARVAQLRETALSNCGASGVVKPVCTSWPGKPVPSVPMIAQRLPSAVSAAEIHWLHDVLPFVPVTPTVSMLSLGSLYQALAIEPASSFNAAAPRACVDASIAPLKPSG